MSFGEIRINIDNRLEVLDEEYAAQVRAVFDDVGLDLASELQQFSPASVAGGWEINASARRANSLNVRLSITNNSYAAFYKIVGRPAGKQPPTQALKSWAELRGLNPYLVARKIGREGTERWQSGDNILGYDPQSRSYRADSPVTQAEERLVRELDAIAIPKRKRKTSRRR